MPCHQAPDVCAVDGAKMTTHWLTGWSMMSHVHDYLASLLNVLPL